MDDVTIERAEPGDAAALASVYQSAYQENRELGFPGKAESVAESTVADWIEQHRVFVAMVESKIIGGVRLEETDPNRIKLSRLGVHEDWKGQGVGSELLDYAESTVRNEDYRTIWLTTPGEHPFLPEFYRSRGYERTGEYPLEYREYDEITMEKRLSR